MDGGLLRMLRAKSASRTRPAESLTGHSRATLEAAIALETRVGRIACAEAVLCGRFWIAVLLAALLHDAGKVAERFQDMVLGRTRSWGHRHEVVSLGFLEALIPDAELRRWVALGVATHHRPLCGDLGGARALETLYGRTGPDELAELIGPVDQEATAALAAWFGRTASAHRLPVTPLPGVIELIPAAHRLLIELLDTWSDDKGSGDVDRTAVLMQGAVTLADHLSSADGILHQRQPLNARFRAELEARLATKGQHLREHQIKSAEAGAHLLLRAPTGSGKTESGLLWSSRQVIQIAQRTGGVPRVFYILPYLASINAMANRLIDLFDDRDVIGVAHSRAASYHLAAAIASEDGEDDRAAAAQKAASRAAATRLFQETIRVGTPYQLLRGVLAGPAHSSIMVDSANSVFVLDELHAYDPRRLGYILATARLWEDLGGRIAVLSATLSQVLADLFTETLQNDVVTVADPDIGTRPRHRIRAGDGHLTDSASIDQIKQRIAGGQSVLVVANSVANAQHLYAELRDVATELYGDDAALLLHSRFRRADRTTIENKIRNRYGSGGSRLPGLLVATQTVEVSLDVDFDVLFTSAAPLEAMLQRFGRVNRLATRPPADVIIHPPQYRTRKGGDEEYADGVYPREPVEIAWQIIQRHNGQTVDEAAATRWLNEIYAGDWGRRWRAEVEDHRQTFTDVFTSFAGPFDDRSWLEERFDELFEGTEAILETDRADYRAALERPGAAPAGGRLLAEDLLIPMPHWARHLGGYDKSLRVRVVDGDYDAEHGLLAVRATTEASYQAGEVY